MIMMIYEKLKILYNNNNNVNRVLKKTLIKPILYTKYNINIGIIWEKIYILEQINEKYI